MADGSDDCMRQTLLMYWFTYCFEVGGAEWVHVEGTVAYSKWLHISL